jgi:hypothetical protein
MVLACYRLRLHTGIHDAGYGQIEGYILGYTHVGFFAQYRSKLEDDSQELSFPACIPVKGEKLIGPWQTQL